MRVFYGIVTHGLAGEFQFLHTGRSVGVDNAVVSNLCLGKTAQVVVSIKGHNAFWVGMLEHCPVGGIFVAVFSRIRIFDRCLMTGLVVCHRHGR